MLDVSGKVSKYTFWVSQAINDQLDIDDSITVYDSIYANEEKEFKRFVNNMDYHKLLNIIPLRYKRSFSIYKRLFKSAEALINYFYIIVVCLIKRIDILHTQYIPFADFVSIEYYIFRFIKLISPKIKIVLTIHDVLPHDINESRLESYCKRYSKVASIFDAYMVHTESCKNDVEYYLKLPIEKIHIAYHPIFTSSYVRPKHNDIVNTRRLKMILFGLQMPYKGTDILIDALNLLTDYYLTKFDITIAGTISKQYFEELKKKSTHLPIKWYPYYLSERVLDEMINDSNIIILPYRSISQSGVLLLSLYFKKIILTSDLPSFIESLPGYDKEWFFEKGNPQSLADLLMKIIDGKIDIIKQQEIIIGLNEKFSLENFANKTLSVYRQLLQEP